MFPSRFYETKPFLTCQGCKCTVKQGLEIRSMTTNMSFKLKRKHKKLQNQTETRSPAGEGRIQGVKTKLHKENGIHLSRPGYPPPPPPPPRSENLYPPLLLRHKNSLHYGTRRTIFNCLSYTCSKISQNRVKSA